VSTAFAQKLGVHEGAAVQIKQGEGSAILSVGMDKTLPDNVVRLAAAHISTSTLGAMFGPITVEKA
jgi:NADH-quinone oxidoreductase subunit G